MPRKGSTKVAGYEARRQVRNTTRPGTHTKVIRVQPYFRQVPTAPRLPHIPESYHLVRGYKTKAGTKIPAHIARNPAPKGIARLRKRLKDEKPGADITPRDKADLTGFTEREKKRINIKDVPDADDDIINYIEPIPGEVIQITYAPDGEIEVWIAEKTPPKKKRDYAGDEDLGEMFLTEEEEEE